MLLRFGFLAVVTLGVVGLVAVASLAIFKSSGHLHNCDDENYEMRINSAIIHWMSWNTLTQYAFSPDNVYAGHHVVKVVETECELSILNAWLSEPKMTYPARELDRMDGRLLIDVTMMSGEKLTYFADRFEICIIEKEICGKINEAWRAEVTAMMEAEIR